MFFSRAKIFWSVFIIFHLFFIETYARFVHEPDQVQYIRKKIHNREYLVKLSFFREPIVTTWPPQSGYDSDLDWNKPIGSICMDIEFECMSDHSCIPLENYCDGKNDCTDKSDEQMCSKIPEIRFSIKNETAPSTASAKTMNLILLLLIIFSIAFKV